MAARFRYICAHEAAHAVVGTYLGLTVLSAAIGADVIKVGRDEQYRSVGATLYQPFSPRQRLPLGVMLAAGTASDRIMRVAADRELDDGDRALIIGAGWGERDFPMLLAAARELLRGPLAAPWRAVTDELRTRDLTGREIRTMLHTNM